MAKASLDLFIETKNYRISANLQIFYEHVVRTVNGIIDARLADCTFVSTGYCEISDDGGICVPSNASCAILHDPFDPLSGWRKVPFINGAPAFENRLMRPIKKVITNDNGTPVANMSSICIHTGTIVE